MNKPSYQLGQLMFEKLNGRIWKIVKIQEEKDEGDPASDYYRCWYFIKLVQGKGSRKEAIVLEETFDRSMIPIDSLKSAVTAKTLYGKI